ncbi:MAG: 5'-nucleotidase, lipoprotein e(P4) family [Flavobacteriales bacterium]|nr:5'-nucleotidase, lipoprotein e(P4) family [Flavobacteriales bacterium]MCB9165855.1 5'-nucleotidase, lipoprotein e(P4) family [Flavobacteriales bacterium]
MSKTQFFPKDRTWKAAWVPILVTVLVAACSGARTTATKSAEKATAPPSSPLVQAGVDAILYQSSSAEVFRLYQQCFELARLRLDASLARLAPGGDPPAVIVDVDETVLDNTPYEITNVANGRGYAPDTWKEWTDQGEARALPGAVDFLRYAVSRGCEVYYITNRTTAEKEATISNLLQQVFPMVDPEHVLTKEEGSDKTTRRARVAEHHRIVLLCGDQLRDFDESFKDRSVEFGRSQVQAMQDTLSSYFVLLPNAIYGTWRDAILGNGTDAEKEQRVRNFFDQNAYWHAGSGPEGR